MRKRAFHTSLVHNPFPNVDVSGKAYLGKLLYMAHFRLCVFTSIAVQIGWKLFGTPTCSSLLDWVVSQNLNIFSLSFKVDTQAV